MSKEQKLTDAKLLRQIAEAKVKENRNNETEAAIETDVKRLVHELQVHQIELEIQNEELREANDRAETALKKYTMMYDFAPMGYFILDENATIHELNFTGAELLKSRRITLTNSNFKLFISKDTLPVFNNLLRTVFFEKTKESCEVMLGKDSDNLHPVFMEAIVIDDDGKCLLSVVDITKLRK